MATPEYMMRARGNLSYLDFVRLVGKLWEDSIGVRSDGETPRVPFRATHTPLSDPDYPCILYSLELRKPMSNEMKPKHREIFPNTADHSVIVRGQRFENIVKFTAIDIVRPDGAEATEEIIELFEDFILECTPIFKELGISDLFYGRRLSDSDESHPGQDIVKRSVVYQVFTEKVIASDVWRLQQIASTARTFIEKNIAISAATPDFSGISVMIDDQLSGLYEDE